MTIKRLVFAFRLPLVPAWGLVNIHTTIGIVRAEYVPNSEINIDGVNWSYDFRIQEIDIPSPGDFTCDDLIDPLVTAFSTNSNCGPNYFTGLEEVDASAVQYIIAGIPNQCGGKLGLVLVPVTQIRTTEG